MKDDYRIVYVRHFREQFEERGKHAPVPITLELVEDTVRNPDFTEMLLRKSLLFKARMN